MFISTRPVFGPQEAAVLCFHLISWGFAGPPAILPWKIVILSDRFKPWAWNRRDADSWKGLPGPMSLNVGPRQLSVPRSLMSGQRELQKPSWHPSCISSLGDGLWISLVIPENRALKTWRLPKIEVPPNHPFIDGFWIINHPAIGGTPMASLWLWKPPWNLAEMICAGLLTPMSGGLTSPIIQRGQQAKFRLVKGMGPNVKEKGGLFLLSCLGSFNSLFAIFCIILYFTILWLCTIVNLHGAFPGSTFVWPYPDGQVIDGLSKTPRQRLCCASRSRDSICSLIAA